MSPPCTNVTLLGIVGVWVGWLVRGRAPSCRSGPPRWSAAAAGALVSVPAAALVFTALFTVGGQVPVPLESLAVAMVGVHTLIGVGEAVITALAVSSIVAVRPDLVYGARRALAQRTTIREEVAA